MFFARVVAERLDYWCGSRIERLSFFVPAKFSGHTPYMHHPCSKNSWLFSLVKSDSCAGFLGVLVQQCRAVTFFRNLTGHLDSAIVGSRCRPNPSVTYPLCCHLCRRFRLNAGLQTPRKRLLIRRVPPENTPDFRGNGRRRHRGGAGCSAVLAVDGHSWRQHRE